MFYSQSSHFDENSSPGTLSNRSSANETRVSSEESAFDSKTSPRGVRESRAETSDNGCSVSESKVSREEITLTERTTEAGTNDSLTEESSDQTSVTETGDCRRDAAIQTSETEVRGSATDQPVNRTSVTGTEDIQTEKLANKTFDVKTEGYHPTEFERNEENGEDSVERECSGDLDAIKYEEYEEAMTNDLREMEEFLNQLARMRNHGVIGVGETREPESRETKLENSSSDENLVETTGVNDAISENTEEQNEDIKQDINTMEVLLKQMIQMRSMSMKPTDATHTEEEQKSSEIADNDHEQVKQPLVENQSSQDVHISQETQQSHDKQTSPQNDLSEAAARQMQDLDCVMATMSKKEMLRNRWHSEPASKMPSLKDISRCASLDATGTRNDACNQSHESSCRSSHRESTDSNNDSYRNSSIETLHSGAVGSSSRTPSSDVFPGLSFVRHLTPSNRVILQNILKVMNIMATNPDQNLYLVTSRLPRLPSKPSYITHVFEISTKNKRRRKTSASSSNPSKISCPSYILPAAADTCSCPSNLLPLSSDKCGQEDEDVWLEDCFPKSEAQCANNNCQHGRRTRTTSLPAELSTCLQNSFEQMQTPCPYVQPTTNDVSSALSSKKLSLRDDYRVVASESRDAYTDNWDELKKVNFADIPPNSNSTGESARDSIDSQTTSDTKHNSLSKEDSAEGGDKIEQSQQSQAVFKTMQFPLSMFKPPMSHQVTASVSNDDNVKLTQKTHDEQEAVGTYQNRCQYITGSITHVVTRARNTVGSTEKWTTRVHNRNLFSAIKSCGTRCRCCGTFHSSVDAAKCNCHVVKEISSEDGAEFVSYSSSGADEIELTTSGKRDYGQELEANDYARVKETQSGASDSSDYGFCHPETGCSIGKKSVVICNKRGRKCKTSGTR